MESKRAKGKRRRRNTPSAGSSRDCCSVLLLSSLEGAAVTQAKVESVDRNVCLSIIISRSERGRETRGVTSPAADDHAKRSLSLFSCQVIASICRVSTLDAHTDRRSRSAHMRMAKGMRLLPLAYDRTHLPAPIPSPLFLSPDCSPGGKPLRSSPPSSCAWTRVLSHAWVLLFLQFSASVLPPLLPCIPSPALTRRPATHGDRMKPQ